MGLSETGPECSVLVSMCTVPGVTLIWMSDLFSFLRYLIISCSSIDCQALSFRLCSEMAVTDLVSMLTICSTVFTWVVVLLRFS